MINRRIASRPRGLPIKAASDHREGTWADREPSPETSWGVEPSSRFTLTASPAWACELRTMARATGAFHPGEIAEDVT